MGYGLVRKEARRGNSVNNKTKRRLRRRNNNKMDYKELERQTADVRSHIKSVYQEMNATASPLLPPKDTEFTSLGSRIEHDQYDVVVCGEVKKGKSSFINAIIGDDILPVNTDVATSQVFRIVNDTHKRYELVFIDGSRKEIGLDGLTKYGSQVAANKDGLPQFDVAIDFIEIHYPIEFLPKNIAIVDTPGIGAVYADHEKITRRYLAKASAVIFIMDPQNPLTAPEKSFVESALGVTNRIIFVMTKMDNYDTEYIINMARRNEEILQPFAEKIWNEKISVFPMSSQILKEAAANDDDDLRNLDVMTSQYDKVQEALLYMIYTMIELGDNIVFANQLIAYDRSVQAAIKDYETTLHDNGSAAQLLQERQKLQTNFATQWGPQSHRYMETTQTIADEANSIPNKLSIICSQTGSLAQRFKSEIENLSSPNEAEQYGNDFSTRIQDAIQQAIRTEIDAVSDHINGLLTDYSSDITQYVASGNGVTVDGISDITFTTDGGGISKSINGFRMNYLNIMLFTAVGSIFGPIGSAIGLIAGIFATWLMSKEQKLREAKNKLLKYLGDALNNAYTKLCIEANPLTQAEQIKRDIKKQASAALKQVYDDQKEKVDALVKELTAQYNADVAARQQKMQQLNCLKQAWKPVNGHLATLQQSIVALKKELNVS